MRADRFYSSEAKTSDQRDEFERDRDRILYSSAFRRLAGITEVIRAGEADVFHTRQQHTIKVAQVGRRLAQKCLKEQPVEAEWVGLDPEVVEAACLAHDLGHPPFGHAGEHLLDELVSVDDKEGFEGNAQSFRVVTKLSARFKKHPGLNLTRATLCACLKYPWVRDLNVPQRSKKWSVYESESREFNFARSGYTDFEKSAEAEIMDWADDVAYSVHDLEDFIRCGALPWHRISSSKGKNLLIQRASESWWKAPKDIDTKLKTACEDIFDFINNIFPALLSEPFEGTWNQRQELRSLVSALTARYINGIKLRDLESLKKGGPRVEFSLDKKYEIAILKQITKSYIIESPTLNAQQKGQSRIIGDLFSDLMADTKKGSGKAPAYIPHRLQCFWRENGISNGRKVADCISSLSEAEATALHARLRGLSSGSVLDPITR